VSLRFAGAVALSRLHYVICCLAFGHAPVVLGRLIIKLLDAVGQLPECDLHHVEYFAGCAHVAKAMLSAGYSVAAYEIRRDPIYHDFLSDRGFAVAVLLLLRLRSDGWLLAAIVCSSFVRINAGSRRSQGRPLGDTTLPGVAAGNIMASRLALLAILASCLGCTFVIEQPAGSMLQWHPRMQLLCTRCVIRRKSIQMWDFGAASVKPTWLYSNGLWFRDIDRFRVPRAGEPPRALVCRFRDVKGAVRFRGTGLLKPSQSYPEPFGTALERAYTLNRAGLVDRASQHRERVLAYSETVEVKALIGVLRDDSSYDGCAGWRDANLDAVFACLAR